MESTNRIEPFTNTVNVNNGSICVHETGVTVTKPNKTTELVFGQIKKSELMASTQGGEGRLDLYTKLGNIRMKFSEQHNSEMSKIHDTIQKHIQDRRNTRTGCGCFGLLGISAVIVFLVLVIPYYSTDYGLADAVYETERMRGAGTLETADGGDARDYDAVEAACELEAAYLWATAELENFPHLTSPWSIHTRMRQQGGFSEEIADNVLRMLEDVGWVERAYTGISEHATTAWLGRSGLIAELESGWHSAETISAIMQKIDDLEIDWYEQALVFARRHAPTSGFMNTENRFRDWMVGEIGFSLSEAQYAYGIIKDELNIVRETVSQRNAVLMAINYLNLMAFSRSGLISQLEFEGFSYEDAVHGADNAGADWYEQATLKAKAYLDIMPFSRQGLVDQLVFDGFTQTQAEHGVNETGL